MYMYIAIAVRNKPSLLQQILPSREYCYDMYRGTPLIMTPLIKTPYNYDPL